VVEGVGHPEITRHTGCCSCECVVVVPRSVLEAHGNLEEKLRNEYDREASQGFIYISSKNNRCSKKA
jgi:hypothetical protein